MKFYRQYRRQIIIAALIIIFAAAPFLYYFLLHPNPAKAAWFNDSWGYRIKLTIDHTKVGADQTDFPVYVDLSLLPAQFQLVG